MLLWLENHRDLQGFQFIFKNQPEAVNISEVKSQFEKDFLKGIDQIPKNEKQIGPFIEQFFDQKFGPQAYETAFRKVIQKYIRDAGVREKLIQESVSRYREKYTQLRETLAHRLKKRLEVRDLAIRGIRQNTRQNLDTLLEAVKNANQVDRLRGKVHENASRNEAIRYLYALNDQYLNVDLVKNKSLTNKQLEAYRTQAEGFKKAMRVYLDKNIQLIEQQTKDPARRKAKIQQLIKKIEAYYQQISGADGLIEWNDLKKIKEQAESGGLELQRKLNMARSPEEQIKVLEALQKLNPAKLKQGALIMINQLIKDARQNSTESKLIAYAQKLTGKKNLSFWDAAHELRQQILLRVQADVRQGYQMILELNQATNQDRASILAMETIKPPSIRVLAAKERERLLSRRLIPKNPMDRRVVEFMSTDRKGRILLLKNDRFRAHLLQSIRDITHHYPKIYNKEFKRGLPKQIKDLRYSRHPDRSSTHDKAARLAALITLAKEAEWTIQNLDQTKEVKSLQLKKTYEALGFRKMSPQIDLRFRDPQKLYSAGYITQAARGGFNGRDIALSGLKIWAGVTLLMNYMNYRRDLGWIGGLEASLTNPYMYAAAGVMYGTHKVQKQPEMAHYFRETAGGQQMLRTHYTLNELKRKWGAGGENRILGFIHNSNEFDVMHKIMEKPTGGARKIQRLMAKIQKKTAVEKNRRLTREDLKTILGNDNMALRLPGNDPQTDRLRYLFYSKFLMTARSTHELQAHALRWPQKTRS